MAPGRVVYKITEKVDHTALHSANLELEDNERGSPEQRDGFSKVLNDIHNIVPTCNSNLKVTIYMNDVAIVLVAGKKENELIITINSRGIVEYNWIKPNYAKVTYVHTTEEVDDRAIHTTYQKLTCYTKLHPEERRGLQIVRHNIDDYTYFCRSNLLVIIYFGEHRADICAGKKENKLKITIDKNGEVEYKWLDRTWNKLLIDKSIIIIEDIMPSCAVWVADNLRSAFQTSSN